MKCIQCDKEYYAYDEDAGTYRESFCSEKCESDLDKELELHTNDRIRIFSSGSQFGDWTASNCHRCKKWSGWDDPPTCDIDMAIGLAYFDDGTVSQEIATRAGYDADRYVWCCGEAEWTED